MKYFLQPLGCATNRADSEKIAAMLESIGYTATDNENEANIIGILACSIRQSAIDRVYGRIHNWNKQKKDRQLITFVSGCILDEDKKKFLKLFDFVLKLDEVTKLPDILNQYGASTPSSFWNINPQRKSEFKALVPIQNGCDKFCTYCAVPYTRGREESRPSEGILKEIKQLIDSGYKQITLLGQNVNSYGLDKPGKELTFAELLDSIGKLTDAASHKIWVYYTSPHPRDMTKEVYEIQAKYNSLANYLNLPMQAGDNTVLKKMNRQYTIDEYMAKLDLARAHIPDLTVSTDVIVGFCGETTEQFENTLTAMKKAAFDLAFIAQYSPRPGALSELKFADNLSKQKKKQRHSEANEVLIESATKINQDLVRKTIPALVETKSRKSGLLLARSEGLKSVEFESADEKLIGDFVNIEITSADPWRLYGKLV